MIAIAQDNRMEIIYCLICCKNEYLVNSAMCSTWKDTRRASYLLLPHIAKQEKSDDNNWKNSYCCNDPTRDYWGNILSNVEKKRK